MKKLFAMAMLACTIAAQAQEVDPKSKFGMELQQHLSMNVNHSKALTRGAEAPKVKVLVSLVPTAGITAADLEAVGCEVKFAMKSVASVIVPVDQLEALAAIPGVRNINLPKKVELLNDKARSVVHVEEVTDPTTAVAAGLPQGYDGTGVLIGIIDVGIDFKHLAFTDEEGKTRFKKAYVQRVDTVIKEYDETGISILDSTVYKFFPYTTPEEIINAVPTIDGTHGSHVLGIMTGRELGNNRRGMAPNANIVAADTKILTDDMLIEAMKSLCDYAEEVKKPIAINMSIGGYGGCPDGCTPASDAMMELTDNGTKPGVIFSLAASNNGKYYNFVHHTFTSDDEKIYVICDTTKENPIEFEGHKVRNLNNPEWIQMWTDHLVDNKEEMIAVFDLDKKTMVDPDTEIGVASVYPKVVDGQTIYHFVDPDKSYQYEKKVITLRQLREILKLDKLYSSSIHTCTDGVTKKNEVWFQVHAKNLRLFQNLRLGACFSYPAGTEILVANYASSNKHGRFIKPAGFDCAKEGTSDGTINLDACNVANITTGNYCTKSSFKNVFDFEIGEGDEELNDVVEASSYGYTFNKEHLPKPEVLAPGRYLESTTNNYYNGYFTGEYGVLRTDFDESLKKGKRVSSSVRHDNQDYWYEYQSGTSMAAPVTTGVIALWLQANPKLSVADVREILRNTSSPIASAYANGDEKLRCSAFGMINALEGLKYIQANMTSISNVSDDQQHDDASPAYNLFGQPTQGQGFVVKNGRVVFVK